jgi:glucose dehydrogenase
MTMELRGNMLTRGTAAVLLLFGAALAIGGAWLLALGGSPYYLVAGLAVAASGVLIALGNGWGASLFELTSVFTLLWAMWEVGWDPWALLPRVLPFLLITLWLFLPWVRRGLHGHDEPEPGEHGERRWWGGAAAVALALSGGWAVLHGADLKAAETAGAAAPTVADWPNLGRDLRASHFSPANQINERNVGRLQQAWIYRTGDLAPAARGQSSAFSVTPIEVDGTLYLCTPRDVVIALDAVSGRERWRYDPKVKTDGVSNIACGGVSYHARGNGGVCARRIVAATLDARLIALDAASGRPCPDFGQVGQVSLLEGLGDAKPGSYAMTAPPLVLGDRIITGGWIRYARSPGEISAMVHAVDAVSGRHQWTWETDAAKTAPQPRPFPPFAADPNLGLVYVVMGPAAGAGAGGARAYDNAVVALSAASGQPKWSFQAVRRDAGHSDLAAHPVLVNLPAPGAEQLALVLATRQGQLFVLDRQTGKPLVKLNERNTAAGAQVFSELSVLPPPLKEEDMWGATPVDQMICRIRFRGAHYAGPFVAAAGGTTSLVYPGEDGLIGTGGIAVDQVNKLIVANTNARPSLIDDKGQAHSFDGPLGVPCTRPPWGHLHLIDLKTNKYAWKEPIGTYAGIGIGNANRGGPLITRGALIFHAGTTDGNLRAYNLFTGTELWKAALPAGGQASPITYTSRNGRQFVVVAAGGDAELGTPTGDYVVAYALPAGS